MADILIKGMEMPKVCKECRFCDYREYGQYIGEDSGMHCYALFKKIFKLDTEARRQRYPNCPLVEVPEHGRLVDADLLEEYYDALEADNGLYTEEAGQISQTIHAAATVLGASK